MVLVVGGTVSDGGVDSSSLPKGAVCKGCPAQARKSWQLQRCASAQAGNRASRSARRARWGDRGFESLEVGKPTIRPCQTASRFFVTPK